MIGMTKDTFFNVPASGKDASAYQVKAANEYGSLSEPATASKVRESGMRRSIIGFKF